MVLRSNWKWSRLWQGQGRVEHAPGSDWGCAVCLAGFLGDAGARVQRVAGCCTEPAPSVSSALGTRMRSHGSPRCQVLQGAQWHLEVVPVVPLWCREGATHAPDSRHSSCAVAAIHLFPTPPSSTHATHYNLLAPSHGNLDPVTAVPALQVRRTACNPSHSLLALLCMQPAFQAAL
jgi:hypothetical protein